LKEGRAGEGRGGAESHNAMSQRRVAWFAWLLLLMVLVLCSGGGGGGGGYYCSFFVVSAEESVERFVTYMSI